jgi:hypothetical protein
MKVKVTLTYAMEFDSENGKSKTTVSFALPDHPKLPISDTVKKLCVEESVMLGQAMISREIFEENDHVMAAPPSTPQDDAQR